MSALGQKRTFDDVPRISALPPKADMDHRGRDVRFVPKADIPWASYWTVKVAPQTLGLERGIVPVFHRRRALSSGGSDRELIE